MSYPVVAPGGSVTAMVRVSASKANATGATVRLSGSGVSISPGSQSLGTVTSAGANALATVNIPDTAKHGVITISATVSAAKAASKTASATVVVTAKENIAPPPGTGPASPGAPGSSGGAPGSGGFNPFSLPPSQVALPPVASPQIAPDAQPILSTVALRAGTEPAFDSKDLAALQAGWLAALAASTALLLARLQMSRRRRASALRTRRAHHVLFLPYGPKLPKGVKVPNGVELPKGKKLTAARLRALPPQPARPPKPPERERSVRVVWVPLRAPRIARP
ncbi:hypothetical protein ACGFNU_32005 [Spirillospora sp. NPDC048911]|uniref:hypothetical protein n=1 Tax=Spirillospora sp. NPDC048911 TaxID=3364527 RepID=UPI003713A3F3